MTAANEFIPGDEGQDLEQDAGASIFGLKLTPPVMGVGIAVLGLGLAGYLGTQFVMPELQKRSELSQKIEESKQKQQLLATQIKRKAKAEVRREEARQRRADVTAMFADDNTLNTLLYDATQLVNRINAGAQGDEQKATLLKFEPVAPPPNPSATTSAPDPDVVMDSTLGAGVNGKLRRKTYQVEFEGTFAQTRTFLRNLELMQSLLVVKNLKSQLAENAQKAIPVDYQKGKIIPVAQPQTKIKSSFELHALLPLKQNEKAALKSAGAK